ncbi:MAG: prepilin-type N-terminal cleavage/methylation domain-containing protein [Gammaproteobacteria bacterium]|jgi:type IV fimbrial biogenesis protein FimT|nr:prepilin-type N-terminal cleavage/methylation domain-containing protein [Gammaproteobacteria bacterium]
MGFTLLELLITLAVLTALTIIGGAQLPNLVGASALRSDVNALARHLRYGRFSALQHGAPVTLCALSPQGRCEPAWNAPLSLFIDHPPKGLRQGPEDRVLRLGPGASRGVVRQWRAFGSRRYLRWRPDGRTDGQNGRFTLSHGEQRYELVITQAGRLRRSGP